jgi:hypothetical protein
MRSAITAVLASLVLLAVPATGAVAAPGAPPSPGSPGIGDPYFPLDGNGGYDVAHYALAIGYQPAANALTGHAIVTARATQALSRFDLDLVGLHVDGVRVDSKDATWTRTDHELRITPKKAVQKGHRFSVEVRYHGTPEVIEEEGQVPGGFFPTSDGGLVIGEPHVAASWFPVNDHPSDKATYAVDITVPRGLQAVSNGALVGTHTSGSHTTYRWRETEPMASYLATATTGHFAITSYRRDGRWFYDAVDSSLLQKPKPRTGSKYAVSGGDDSSYKRLTRRFTVPATGGQLTFHVVRNNEPDWDFFTVEAHRVGTSSWTTLPDLNGHTTTSTGNSCPYWLTIHPFLAHYQSDDGSGGCAPTGSTGAWNAATGRSDGYETWTVDLAPYAGHQVVISLTNLTDDVYSFPGAYVDDIVGPGGQGTTSFENDGNTLDGWTVPGAPAGSPGNPADWRVVSSDPTASLGERAQAAFAQEPEILRFLSSVLGPYPFKQAGGIVDDDPDLGYALENQTRPIYSQVIFLEPPEEAFGIVAHELAHQWTGDSLSVASWRETWLNEGFATYLQWLWSEHHGDGTVQEFFDADASIPADDPFWQLVIGDPGPDHFFDGPVYDRGAMTLHALRQRIGDADFFHLLRRWTVLHAGGNVSTTQFIALAQQVSGKNLGGFFKTWLFTPSKPAGLPETAAKRNATVVPTREARIRAHRGY